MVNNRLVVAAGAYQGGRPSAGSDAATGKSGNGDHLRGALD